MRIQHLALALLAVASSACIEDADAALRGRARRGQSTPVSGAVAFSNTISAHLDGTNEYLTAADNASFDTAPRETLTVCAWARMTTWAANDGWVSKRATNQHAWALMNGTATAVRFAVSSVATATTDFCDTAGAQLVNGQKAFVCGVYNGPAADADEVTIYIDATARAETCSGTIPDAYLDTTAAVEIGRQQTAMFGDGYIDEVTIWSAALTAGNITTLYAGGTYTDPRTHGIGGLISYWRLGDGDTFPTSSDVGGTNTNHMTATNMESTDFESGTVP